ncbi:hypothetical protein HB662_06705 [Roseomonas frigidaquae]|uniref:Uncharacterized protein n=1 Tax=Falsiroseomonas frigidaquae TaxID=487318 RepID=A0ABX1EV57_9PROT|nr:hypothetical protein [Falsiroseomonas frigidaquae]NKE44460.1 hypothetical protein [Falsiroseomonas frigidaquae]
MSAFANAATSALLVALAGAAILVVAILGPFGLVLLGLLTLVVCVRLQLVELVPSWGSRVDAGETRARPAERAALAGQLRFYRRCGLLLLAAGLAGTAFGKWRRGGQRRSG